MIISVVGGLIVLYIIYKVPLFHRNWQGLMAFGAVHWVVGTSARLALIIIGLKIDPFYNLRTLDGERLAYSNEAARDIYFNTLRQSWT
uniref:Uncharacterized protein n=1 Tax=Acrobeloides nanus TaxID=290746 RepID=A0A914DA86_9BILA